MEINKALYEEIIALAIKILMKEKEKPEEERIEYNASELSKVIDKMPLQSTRIRPTRKEIEQYLILAINEKRLELKDDSKRSEMIKNLKVQVDKLPKPSIKIEESEEPKKKGSGFYTRGR